MTTTFPTVRYEQHDGLLQLTLNRPHRANTIDYQLAEDMSAAMTLAEADPDCRVVLITGEGRHFCGGADLKAVQETGRGTPSVAFIDGLATSPLPIIAGINGVALGGGFEIAIACDFRIMSADAKIGLPEVKFGGLPGAGGTQRTARVAGPAAAKQLIMTGEPVTAHRALELGLVDQIVDPADLQTACEALASTLKSRPAFALTAAKRAIDDGLDLPLSEGLELERVTVRQAITPEMRRAAQRDAAARDRVYARIFTGADD
ncbi:enoyl-CoA hydratase/isomerase family protein [Rhodococcus opacus]|uniref:enoyl-CoA hydratase/isomerase family protein n=1 Tax=Rhodococcus opacus TaxID=37919 RepID=UPI000B27C3BC|nr:enoyl-CoA hydratase/isomerase family protein [Rhodococcus opacus]